MISAWKRLTSKKTDDVKSPFPNGVSLLDESMQKKFSKGVQYNMKIILKGDRNTGKTCLFHRLQGKPFQEQYIPTHEIQVCSINWNSQAADGAVKVDVWDIVDKGQRKRLPSDKLKLKNDDVKDAASPEEPTLDADFMDVYKGTHGVLMLFDITKPWTWKYIERELPRIPHHIPVLVLANFRDMGEHRMVVRDEAAAFVEYFDRPTGSAQVFYTEASCKNGFGLKYIHSFLNLPFLILQRESLLRHLERNSLLLDEFQEKLYPSEESEDQNYDIFLDQLHNKTETRGSSPGSDNADTGGPHASQRDSPTPDSSHAGTPTPRSTPSSGLRMPSAPSSSSRVRPPADGRNINDFVPGTELEDAFLSDATSAKTATQQQQHAISDDDSDTDDGNPLVMQFQDIDFDAEDTRQRIDSKGIDDSESSDDDSPETHPVVVADMTDAPSHSVDVLSNFMPSAVDDGAAMDQDIVIVADTVPPAVTARVVSSSEAESDPDDAAPSYAVARDIDLDKDSDDDEASDNKVETLKPALEPGAPSFSIDADSLELFMSDQMRKTSLSSVDEKPTSSSRSSKKSSIAAEPSSEKKKKKRSKKPKSVEETTEKSEKRKKKSKSKEGGKTREKSSRSTKGNDADYEFL